MKRLLLLLGCRFVLVTYLSLAQYLSNLDKSSVAPIMIPYKLQLLVV